MWLIFIIIIIIIIIIEYDKKTRIRKRSKKETITQFRRSMGSTRFEGLKEEEGKKKALLYIYKTKTHVKTLIIIYL